MRLIDADELKTHVFQPTGTVHESYIDSAPTVDAVKHGRWVFDENGNDWGIGAWLCSMCGCKNDNLGIANRVNPKIYAGSNYCPNCGAKMGGNEE